MISLQFAFLNLLFSGKCLDYIIFHAVNGDVKFTLVNYLGVGCTRLLNCYVYAVDQRCVAEPPICTANFGYVISCYQFCLLNISSLWSSTTYQIGSADSTRTCRWFSCFISNYPGLKEKKVDINLVNFVSHPKFEPRDGVNRNLSYILS